MKKKLFTEEQSYKGMDLMALLLIFMAAISFRLYKEIVTLGFENMLCISVCVGLLFVFGFGLKYLNGLRMKTSITEKNITVKISPFHAKKHKIKLKDVESCAVVRTPAAAKWHGTNLSFSQEKYYSFSGRNGLRISTKNGETYFVGSRRLDDMERTVRQVMDK